VLTKDSSEQPIGVMIIGQDRLFVDAVLAWLGTRDDIRVVEQPPSEGTVVDVILIDSSQRRDEAIAATWRASDELPTAKVLVLGVEQEDERLVGFIEAGALGYLLRGASPADLVGSIRDLAMGRTRCSPQVASAVIHRINDLLLRREAPREHQPEPLTPRELEILESIAVGLSNKEIGKRLRISVSTVKNHVHNILEKLQVDHRREAIKIAYEHGLIPDSLHPAARD
jgi:DNA-binding NarL/FixJ family response regulator